MTVILNQAALTALLETENGPVGRFTQQVAAAIVIEAQNNIRGYFGTAPSLEGRVDDDVDFEMEGSSATIGIRDGGNKAQRLAIYQAEGRFPWLTRAIDAVRGRFGGR